MTNSQNSGSFPPRKHSWECTQGSAGPFLHVRGERASSWLCASRTHEAGSYAEHSVRALQRLPEIQSFLPAVGASGVDGRASNAPAGACVEEKRQHQFHRSIPFLVAATNTTAANTTTERQAQTQIAASSASDFGMLCTRGVSSWAKHYRSNLIRHEIPSQQSAMSAIRHLRRLQHLANGCPRWRKISGQPSPRPRCTISRAHLSALVTNGCGAGLTRRPARWSRFCNPIRAGAFSVNSCAVHRSTGGSRQSTHASVRGPTRKISCNSFDVTGTPFGERAPRISERWPPGRHVSLRGGTSPVKVISART
jgi:hypothetical protein